MIAVVQRVSSASVHVRRRDVSEIGAGLLILLAIGENDAEEESRWVAEKCAELRIFEDQHGKMNKSLLETGGSALVVSQFTLYGDCSKGRRPSFGSAAPPARAQRLFDVFCEFMRAAGLRVETGVFGEKMAVRLENDGPVTLIVQKEGRTKGEAAGR
ncbi:MAG: D-tyrosyl-tRNA(Tyr) deacylase [Latescibacteria bacterium DG_63]|nr:MAG: D-tyrosyl-tRNA(Tyr) deacylase [Latescibacteria bacterium DG_63]